MFIIFVGFCLFGLIKLGRWLMVDKCLFKKYNMILVVVCIYDLYDIFIWSKDVLFFFYKFNF